MVDNNVRNRLVELASEFNYNRNTLARAVRKDKVLLEYVKNETAFLADDVIMVQRLWHIENKSKEVGRCKVCGEVTSFDNGVYCYRHYCSNKCAHNDREVKDKMRRTNLERWGTECTLQNSGIRRKVRETWMRKYKTDHPWKSEVVWDKIKQTNLKNFGVEYSLSSEAVRDKIKQTNLRKLGVEHPSLSETVRDKMKQTHIERYGTENLGHSEEAKERRKLTNLRNFGVEYPLQSEKVRGKIKQTNLEKYGVEYPWESEKVKEKVKQTFIRKYGVDRPIKNEEIKEKMAQTRKERFFNVLINSDRLKDLIEPVFDLAEYNGCKETYNWKCKKCGSSFEDDLNNGSIPRCFICFPFKTSFTSKYEEEIENWLKNELNITNVKRNDRTVINPKEIDIYLPDYKLAIEFNGLYFHSEENGGKDKNYHLSKTKECELKGIQLLHIFEDEWHEKQATVKSIIRSKLGKAPQKINARECAVREVTNEVMFNFLFDNHLQEPIACKYNYGLYYGGELVQVVGISKSRFDSKYDYELVRSCSKVDTIVVGGFSKLMFFIKDVLKLGNVVSYVDRRYFNGAGYERSGWKYVGETDPGFFYVKDGIERFSRQKFQKYKLVELFPDLYDKELTGEQTMQLAGYDKVWDVGHLVFNLQ